VGVEVSRLVRVRYDQFNLPKWLKPGKSRFLDDDAVTRVYKRLELEQKSRNPSTSRQSRRRA
jgi:16S rRNA U516 pseudouridylate synthase RsuA-like enzyme